MYRETLQKKQSGKGDQRGVPMGKNYGFIRPYCMAFLLGVKKNHCIYINIKYLN